jgi:hypothetical protein
MAEQTVNAASNPALANKLIKEAMESAPVEETTPLTLRQPSDGSVTLPGGYLTVTGEVVTNATVRELNGLDEEAMAKQPNMAKALTTVLNRAVVSIGDESANEALLDNLLSGDADALMLGIYRTTFGDTCVLPGYCSTCNKVQQVEVDLVKDLSHRALLDPINDRVFTVRGKKAEYTVKLPSRKTQREMMHNLDKTSSELNTILLNGCVVSIGSTPVLSVAQVNSIGLADRKAILKSLTSRIPGPQFEAVPVPCGACDGKVEVPISLGAIFRS